MGHVLSLDNSELQKQMIFEVLTRIERLLDIKDRGQENYDEENTVPAIAGPKVKGGAPRKPLLHLAGKYDDDDDDV